VIKEAVWPAPFVNPKGKFVLITGCDTGFGRLLSAALDKDGYNVISGCLTEDGVKGLTRELSERATVLRLDITSDEDVARCLARVKQQTPVLHALVNNAGINSGSLIDWSSMNDFRKVMDVNYIGGVNMTKTFLPLLVATRGSRVVNVTSVAGIIAAPGMGPYAGSKHAFDAFSHSLRRECREFGLHVSILSPGFMKTAIVINAAETNKRTWDALPAETRARYGDQFFQEYVGYIADHTRGAEDPAKMTVALQHAVGSTQPKLRYYPGNQASLFFRFVGWLPHSWVDRLLQLRQRMLIKQKPQLVQEQKGQ